VNSERDRFTREVEKAAKRKMNADANPRRELWFGLGTMGLIGWSVVVPTLLGAALGQWLDKHHSGGHEWTLALMVAGLLIGCMNSWHWIAKEDAEINRKEEADHE
jgi:ATP synthase protein I